MAPKLLLLLLSLPAVLGAVLRGDKASRRSVLRKAAAHGEGHGDDALLGAQEDLWPRGHMPGKYMQPGQPQEKFVRTEDSPEQDQMLRIACSPHHVGTYGHYVLDTATPTVVPFIAPGSDTAIVVVPGGGGLHIAWEVEGTSIAKFFQSKNISAFIVKYRVPTSAWQEHSYLMDVQRAVSLARKKYNMAHVGIFGSSFGGKAAIETFSERQYARLDPVDDSSHKPDFAVILYPGSSELGLSVAGSAPPMFLAVSEDDPCVGTNFSKAYYGAVQEHGANPSELHIYPSGGHGFGTCEFYDFLKGGENCEWPAQFMEFLRQHGFAT